MLNSLFILNADGDVIIEKHYRGLINRNVTEYFLAQLNKASDVAEITPIIPTPKYYLINVQRNGVYFLAVIQKETAPLLVIEFLHKVADTFADYFGQLNELLVKENFVTVYQLLEEMMDNGIPFTTEPNILKDMILPPNVYRKVLGSVAGKQGVSADLPNGSLSNVRWRKSGVKYSTNEIYFDIIEEIDAIVDNNGMLVSSEVSAEVQCNCKLSGMPDLTLSFNNPRIMDDVSFHPCVRNNKWEHEKVISFVPPDGDFKLMSYRIQGNIQLPMYVKPTISYNETGGSVHIMVGGKATGGKPIEKVVVTVPFSKSVSTATLTANTGSVSFDDAAKILTWNIGKIPKDRSPILEGTVALKSDAPKPDANPTLGVDFTVIMFSASGIKVDSLSCNERYKPYKGVRSIVKAGNLQIRS